VQTGKFFVSYVWHDSIDAKSFRESWDIIKQGKIGHALEAYYGDIFWDKLMDMDYDVSIPFDHIGG
jgi:hypothetical protein